MLFLFLSLNTMDSKKAFLKAFLDLDAAVVENNNSGSSSDTNTYVQGGGRKFSQDDIETLKNKSSDSSNMMKEIETIKNKCRHLEWNTESRNEHAGQNDRSIESLISEMNYRYCIASVTCPGRIAALNKCFSRYPPEFVEALYREGRRAYLCGKERGAVERCCGQKVQSVMRQLLEDK